MKKKIELKKLPAWFYATESGNEPVREWLKELGLNDRRTVGEDIMTAEYGWPLGMPLIKKIAPEIWEVRSNLKNKIARVLFAVYKNKMVLLHGFIKKDQKTPPQDIKLAEKRLAELKKGEGT